MEITARAAFIDLFFLILCLRIIYVSVSKGVLQENFKVVGIFISSFFAFQYFSLLTNNINSKISFLNPKYLYFISFLLIFLGIGIVFNLLWLIISLLFKQEQKEIGQPQKWLGFFLGSFRAFFLSSIIIFLLYLSPLNSQYFNDTISYRVFKNIAPKIYQLFFKFYSKFNTEARLNKEVEEYYEAN